MTRTSYTYIDSPLGEILVAAQGSGLSLISFQRGSRARRHEDDWVQESRPFRQVAAQLGAYFAGRLDRFDLELSPEGTPFQKRVWKQLAKIPYGETISYGQLARRIRQPTASRAVGAANGANPLPIVLPCHRVIGSSGKLVGYGGGLSIKRQLLRLEGAATAPS